MNNRHSHLLTAGTAAVALALLTACGTGADTARDDDRTDPGAETSEPPAMVTLVVNTTSAPGEDGRLFTEGAVPEIRLVSSDGTVIKPASDHEDIARFGDLALGDYTLKAAHRPCAGNCGALDPPTGQCQGTVEVDGDTRASVEFVVGEMCTITG